MSLGLLEPDGLFPPASPADLAALKGRAGPLPADFADFLLRSDGYNGALGPEGRGYAQLWPALTILEAIGAYEGAANVPGLLLVGSNGGPTAYGVIRSSPEGVRFVSVPFLPLVAREVRVLGATFAQFLAALSRGEGW